MIRKDNYISILKKELIKEWKLNNSPLTLTFEFHDEILEDIEKIPENTTKNDCIIVKFMDEKNNKEEINNMETWLISLDGYFNNVCNRLRYCLIQIRSEDETGSGTLVSKDGKFVTSLHIIIGREPNKIKIERARPTAT